MQKDGKNKAKDNLWLKQGAFFVLVLLWVLAIYFKNQLANWQIIAVFIILLLATSLVVFWLNRAFLGLTHVQKKTDSDEKR